MAFATFIRFLSRQIASLHQQMNTMRAFVDKAYLNPSRVWLEASGWVLGCHSTLDCAAIHPDLVLFEAEFWQAAALAHMELSMHQVHAVAERERR